MQHSGPITTKESSEDGRMKSSIVSRKKKLLKRAVNNGKGGPGAPGYGYKPPKTGVASSFKGAKTKSSGLKKISFSKIFSTIKKLRAKSPKLKKTKNLNIKGPALRKIKLVKLKGMIKK